MKLIIAFALALLFPYIEAVAAEAEKCPRFIPDGRQVDNCLSDEDCIRSNRGLHCCYYCGAHNCQHYCRGAFGTNGDADDHSGQCPQAMPAYYIDTFRIGCKDGLGCFREGRGTMCCTHQIDSTSHVNYCYGYAPNVTTFATDLPPLEPAASALPESATQEESERKTDRFALWLAHRTKPITLAAPDNEPDVDGNGDLFTPREEEETITEETKADEDSDGTTITTTVSEETEDETVSSAPSTEDQIADGTTQGQVASETTTAAGFVTENLDRSIRAVTISPNLQENCKRLVQPCKHHYECCSNNCANPRDQAEGLCQLGRGITNYPNNCSSIKSQCIDNEECCSNNCANDKCEIGRGFPTTKIPAPFAAPNSDFCLTLNASCQEDYECCSNKCVRNDVSDKSGVCNVGWGFITDLQPHTSETCRPPFYNHCQEARECCSNKCNLQNEHGMEMAEGMCAAGKGYYRKPRKAIRKCMKIEASCSNDADCCSNLCRGIGSSPLICVSWKAKQTLS